MKKRAFRKLGAIGVIGLCLLGGAGASCTQPDMLCDVGSGAYATQYFPKEPESDCLKLPGELVGMATYNPPRDDGTGFDASRTTVSVQAFSIGALTDGAQSTAGAVDADPSHMPFSLGEYSNKPNDDDFCSAPSLSFSEQHIPETAYTDDKGNAQVFPETRLAYRWSNLQVYTTFATPGNAATGEVTITREVTDPATGMKDACTTTYTASALFPAVSCGAPDAMGQPTVPDDTKCCATADLSSGRSRGSGINPDFKVKCDPELLLCVLDWRPGEAFPPRGENAFCKDPG